MDEEPTDEAGDVETETTVSATADVSAADSDTTEADEDGGRHVTAEAEPLELDLSSMTMRSGKAYHEEILFDDDGNWRSYPEVMNVLEDRGVRFFTVGEKQIMNDSEADLGVVFSASDYVICVTQGRHPEDHLDVLKGDL